MPETTPPPLTADEIASPKTHAERMMELRDDFDMTNAEMTGLSSELRAFLALCGYADSLAAALEAARAKLKVAEEKLRAAERLAEAVRKHIGPERAGFQYPALREALSAFDAINPDGSTGGAGEGVG